MVVSGAPEVCDDHALKVAHQGLDMIFKAAEVKSPATGKSLQVREISVGDGKSLQVRGNHLSWTL